MLLSLPDQERLRAALCVTTHLLDRPKRTAMSDCPHGFPDLEEKSLEHVGQCHHDPPRRTATAGTAAAKAVSLLLTIFPGAILWNFATAHDALFAKSTANLALSNSVSKLPVAVQVGSLEYATTLSTLTGPQLLSAKAPDYFREPRPLTLYYAILCMTSLLLVYADMGTASKAQRYLVWLGATLSPMCGFLLGLGIIASALVVLPLNIIVALIAADVLAWLSRDRGRVR